MRAALLAVLTATAPALAGAQAPPPSTFTVRADPKLAAAINPVLARLALDVPAVITRTTDGRWVRPACAGRPEAAAPNAAAATSDGARANVSAPPCVQVRRNVRTMVRPEETWEGLAARMGLAPGARPSFPDAGPRDPLTSMVSAIFRGSKPPAGHIAVADQAPAASRLTLDPASGVTTAEAFAAQIAAAVGCAPSLKPSGCLAAKGVEILPVRSLGSGLPAKGSPDEPAPTPSPPTVAGPGEEQAYATAATAMASTSPAGESDTSAERTESTDQPRRTEHPGASGHIPDDSVTMSIARPRPAAVMAAAAEAAAAEAPSAVPAPAPFALALGAGNPAPPPPLPAVGGPTATPVNGAAGVTGPPETPTATGADDASPPSDPAPERSKVASGQWPYDRVLFTLTLADAAKATNLQAKVVGVVDIGLADAAGKPLSPDALALDATGDDASSDAEAVAICPAIDVASLPSGVLEAFSHGAVISSIIAGMDVRLAPGATPTTTSLLPRVDFRRLYRAPCPPSAAPSLDSATFNEALEALFLSQARIINASVMGNGYNDSVTEHVKQALSFDEILLVTAAGNTEHDLDDGREVGCPACLRAEGTDTYDQRAGARTIVVGAATKDLRRLANTGFGRRVVQIYAPGEPAGARDVRGGDASFEPATSYAAPYVARAIALIETLSPRTTADQAAVRAALSTWPLFDADGLVRNSKGDPVGVLDLAKAAAVRTYAVEAYVEESDHQRRLRTWIGDIPGGLGPLSGGLCDSGPRVSERDTQAVMFDIDGPQPRSITFVPQRAGTLGPPPVFPRKSQYCSSSGVLRIHDLRDGEVTVPLQDVLLIIAPLRN